VPPGFIHEVRRTLPPKTPKKIDASRENRCLVQPDLTLAERLSDTVRTRDSVTIDQGDVESVWMS
jgi:hypothetical protein